MSPPPAKKRNTTATKKKNPKPTPNPSLGHDFVSFSPSISPPRLMSLPYDILLNCLARVSRLYYPTLSLVSKRFRSLLASSELYKARSVSSHAESCLYVCFSDSSGSSWYTLCLKPGKEKEYVLARVPIPYSRPAWPSDLVADGSSIYHIARSFSGLPATVSVLDCRTHTWREAPTMRVGLISFTPSVLDRKIYVAGTGKDGHSGSVKNFIEVFDTKTQIWEPDPIPCCDTDVGYIYKSVCIGGKIHVVNFSQGNVAAYNSKEGRWDMVELGRSGRLSFFMNCDCYCVIQNVLYSVDYGVIGWYDLEVSRWRELKGLVGLPEFPPKAAEISVRLADYGGKMVVFWNQRSPCFNWTRKMMIFCAVISLERRQESCEIWGHVEWFKHVLTISYYDLENVLAVTL